MVVIIIGLVLKNKAGQNITEYFLSGRRMPWYLAGISMVATTFAADTPLAVTELVSEHGIAGNWFWWNMMIGGMLTVFFFSRLWRRAGVLTELEFTELRYGGKKAAWLRGFRAVYLGLFMNILIMGWVSLAFLSILEVLFGLTSAQAMGSLAVVLVLIGFYSILSGLQGIVINDVLQFVLAMTGFTVLAVFVINSPEVGGIANLKTQLPEGATSFFPSLGGNGNDGSVLALGVGSFLAYIGFQWWTSWYPGSEPGGGGYIAQRMMSTRDEKSAFWATFLFQIAHFCIRPWPWILVALAVPVLYPGLSDDEVRNGFVMAMKDFLPSGFLGLMFIAFVAAYMSTISTHLNWGASYLVNDLAKRFTREDANINWVSVSRLFSGVLLVFAFLITMVFDTITGVWFFVIEASAGIGAVLILRWYWWRINAWSEITAVVTPLVLSFVFKVVMGYEFPVSFFMIMACTSVAWLAVTFLTKPESPEILQSFVRRVQPAGAWRAIYRLNDQQYPYHNTYFIKLFGGWLFAVLSGYTFLFFTGSLLLLEWQNSLFYAGGFMISLTILYQLITKGRILD